MIKKTKKTKKTNEGKMKKYPYPLSELEEVLAYKFKNKDVINTAMTHSSYSNELKAHGNIAECNERLEFLGDSVLSVAVSEYLFEKFAEYPEGALTRMRASLVCEKALAECAEKIALGNYLLLGHGEDMNKGRERKSILADAFEALLAAIFLDAGDTGFIEVKKFLLPFIETMVEDDENKDRVKADYKTALQQIVQQAGGEIFEYVLIGEEGPDHMKLFEVEARLNSNVIGRGKARTKREAEQMAAKEALELFGES